MDSDKPWQPDQCTYDELFEVIRERRMVYNYDQTDVPRADIEKILEAARWAPSAHNTQMWEFIVVDDPDILTELGTWLKKQREWIAMIDEEFPTHGRVYLDQVSVAIVVAGDIRCKAYFPDVAEYGFGEWEVTNDRYYESIGCCMQNIHLAAKTLGYGTVHLTVQRKYQDRMKDALNLPPHIEIHNVVPIGVPAGHDPGQNVDRYPLTSMLHWNTYDAAKTTSDEEFIAELHDRQRRVRLMHGESD